MIKRFYKHFNSDELNHWNKMSNEQGRWLVSRRLNNRRGYSLIGDRFETKEIADQFIKACVEHEFFEMCYGNEELIVSAHPDLNYNYHVSWKVSNGNWEQVKCSNKLDADNIFGEKLNELSNNDEFELIIMAD